MLLDHAMHMKRTNLVLNEILLNEALKLSGERTYSRAVDRALDAFVRRARAGRILELAGTGLWKGDLAEMRDDRPRRIRRHNRAAR
jgi:Arc/MetJ family transcription regulator